MSDVNKQLLDAIKEVRESLRFANDCPDGPITDTIWMMHRPETMFDFMTSTIAAAEQAQQLVARDVLIEFGVDVLVKSGSSMRECDLVAIVDHYAAAQKGNT